MIKKGFSNKGQVNIPPFKGMENKTHRKNLRF